MSSYIIPSLILCLLIYSTYKRNNTYNSFVFGAKNSFNLVIETFPNLVAIFIMIEVFNVSGLNIFISNLCSPIFKFFGIPNELNQLVLIKPFSGSGSLAILENIFNEYGADSYLARCGCAIAGSSEAIFYVTAVYFSKTNVKKFSYGIPIALISNLIGAICACFICKFI